MTMINLTITLVCMISQKSLPRMRRPCEQIARATLCAVALIAWLSGCTDYSNYVFDTTDHQHNVELVGRLILDEDRADHYNDSSKGMTFLNDTTLAVATERGSVLFVDVSDPTDLALIGRFDPGGLPNESQYVNIVTMEGFAYVSFGISGTSKPSDTALMVVDARQPAAPELAFKLPVKKGPGQVVAAKDNYLYTETADTIQVWEATDPFGLSLAGVYSPPQSRLLPRDMEPNFTPPTPRQLAAEKSIGSFMAHKDPEVDASHSCNSAYIVSADVENDFLYFLVNHGRSFTTVCEDGGLWIIDVSSPVEPLPVAFLAASEFGVIVPHGYHDIRTGGKEPGLFGLAADSSYVYLSTALGTTNMAIVDVSDPASPVIFGWRNAPDSARTEAVEDGLAYVHELNYYASWATGNTSAANLQVFDVTDPVKPVLIGLINEDKETSEGIWGVTAVAVRNGYIFLAETQLVSEERGLTEKTKVVALRLIDPDAPPLELQFNAPGN